MREWSKTKRNRHQPNLVHHIQTWETQSNVASSAHTHVVSLWIGLSALIEVCSWQMGNTILVQHKNTILAMWLGKHLRHFEKWSQLQLVLAFKYKSISVLLWVFRTMNKIQCASKFHFSEGIHEKQTLSFETENQWPPTYDYEKRRLSIYLSVRRNRIHFTTYPIPIFVQH